MSITSNNRESASAFIITLVWPFVGLILSLSKWRKPWAKNAFWLACVYMSFIHIYAPIGGGGADIERYVAMLEQMNIGNLNLIQAIALNGKPDYYQPFVTYLVSRFSGNGHVLFLIFGFVYGFFYSRNVWYVLERLPERFPKILFLLIATFILVCPIWNVGGVRMWTALHVFCYGTLPYVFEKDKTKMIWAIASPLFHFSFILPTLLVVLFAILPDKRQSSRSLLVLSMMLFVVSSFVNLLQIEQIGDLLRNAAPVFFEENVAGYLGEEYVDRIAEHQQNHSLFYKLNDLISTFEVIVLTIVAYFVLVRQKDVDDSIKRLFSFALILYSIGNVMAVVPSGGRYVVIAQMFIFPALIFVFALLPYNRYKGVVNLVIAVSIILVVFDLRTGADCYGFNLLIGNFFTAIPLETNVSFIYSLKQIF